MTNARAGFGTLLKMGDGGETPVGGGGSTTTDDVTLAGATVIPVTATTGFTVADTILIGGAGGEQREIASISAGVSLTVTDAVDYGWASGTTVVEVEDESYATIAEVLDITLPQLTSDLGEVTNHSSPGAYEEQIPTILRTGTVSFDVNINLSDPTHDENTGLLYVWVNRLRRNFHCHFPHGVGTDKIWEFNGYVTSFQPQAPVAGILRATINIKVLGALDFDAVEA